MLFPCFISVFAWVASSSIASAESAVSPSLQTRIAPRVSSVDMLQIVRRALSKHSLHSRDTVLKNGTSIEKSWDGAVLFSYTGSTQKGNIETTTNVEITCTTCYLKVDAQAQLTIDSNFNTSQAFHNLTKQIGGAFDNTTDTTIDYVQNYVRGMGTKLKDGIDLDDFDLPPIDVKFDIDIPDIPECRLKFQFDGMELYMMMNTVLSGGSTYTFNLYSSNTPVGISVSDDLQLGIIFSVDLILGVEAEIDISSGFHIRLDDGVAIDIPLFGNNVSKSKFDGGTFEFLPVTIQSVSGALTAILRVGVHAGVELSTPVTGIPGLSARAGVEVGVFANIAEFTTNVTVAPEGGNDGCRLHVEESYQLALGAAAGATVALNRHSWGPSPETTSPIWGTTMGEACALRASSTPTTTATIAARAIDTNRNLTTTTISTEITYTGVVCLSSELVNCPVSLQKTTKTSTEMTLTTAVPSGVRATFPQTTGSSITKTIPFGSQAKKLFTSSSSSTSSLTTPTSVIETLKDEIKGVDNKVIIGVSVGVGVPLVIAIIVGGMLWYKRRMQSWPPRHTTDYDTAQVSQGEPFLSETQNSTKKHTTVTVVSPRP